MPLASKKFLSMLAAASCLFFCFTDLTPTHISWQPSVNAGTHHTDRYANTELTVRRGQAFTITLYFNRPKQTGESLAFVTEIGNTPLTASVFS